MENLDEICLWCRKKRLNDSEWDEHQKSIEEVRNSFQYHVGGVQVTKKHFDAILERGYIIPEELDKDRR